MSVFVWSLQIKTSTVGSALLTYFNRIICFLSRLFCYCSFFVHLCCLCCLGMWRENYNYASQIAPALINVKLISKSLTEGVVYRVAARLSIARVFSVRNRTAPWEGRPLLKKSFTAFLNSELRKLYKTGLMTELRWPNIRKTVSNSGCFAIIDSALPTEKVRDAQKWVRQPTDHERGNDQKRCLDCANVPLL